MTPRRLTVLDHVKGLGGHLVSWAAKNPRKALAALAIALPVGSGGTALALGKDPRNALVYVSEPILGQIRDMLRPIEDRQVAQGAAIENVVEVIQEMKDYERAQEEVDRRRRDMAIRARRKSRLLNPPPISSDTTHPFDPSQGFTADVLSGKTALYGGQN